MTFNEFPIVLLLLTILSSKYIDPVRPYLRMGSAFDVVWGYGIRSRIFITCGLACRFEFKCGSYPALTYKGEEYQEYCADAFVLWFISRYIFLTIHLSHSYRSIRDIRMLGHRYLQRSEWLPVPKRTGYIYAGRVYHILFRRRVILADPTGVIKWGFTLLQDKSILLPITLK